MKGFYGRILKIDLDKKKFNIETVSDDIYDRYLGGKGLVSYLLYELNPPNVDPLAPENCLIFATGPVSGSSIWGSCRYGVFGCLRLLTPPGMMPLLSRDGAPFPPSWVFTLKGLTFTMPETSGVWKPTGPKIQCMNASVNLMPVIKGKEW
jgi:hypothetical protein